MHITAPHMLAVAAAALLAGPAHAADPPAVKTPDDKVLCFFEKQSNPHYVYCDWSNADDVAAQVNVRGKAEIVTAGGLLDPTGVPVLRHGRSKRVGKLRCSSHRSGMRCVSVVTGNGFRVGPNVRPKLFAGRCGNTVAVGAGAFEVRAKGVLCRRATRVARTYYATHEVRGWRCRKLRLDLEHYRVWCSHRASRVRFDYGA